MSPAADVLLRQGGEPAFDLVEPRRGGRREMHVKARMPGESILDGRCLVGAVVVHYEVNVEHCRHVGLDGAQEL